MRKILEQFIPDSAVPKILKLLEHEHLVVKIRNERKTKHGDYKALPSGKHQITINSNLNPYRFLITLVHEIAHFETFKNYGSVKPHGKEWKQTFQHLMLPFLNPEIFPDELLPLLAKHFKNPKASSDADMELSMALKRFDQNQGKTFVFEVPAGKQFRLYNGRIFQKGKKRVKRYECVEVETGRLYLFNPNAEVEILDNN